MRKIKGVMIGKYETRIIPREEIITSIPKKKFRVLIQERKSQGAIVEEMTSFMIYDFVGYSIKTIKSKLKKVL